MTAEEIVKELTRQELEEQWLEMKAQLKEVREIIINLINQAEEPRNLKDQSNIDGAWEWLENNKEA